MDSKRRDSARGRAPGRTAGWSAVPTLFPLIPPETTRALYLGALLITLVGLIAGCAPRVELDMTAGPRLNPGPGGEPLPVLLRVYQLDDRTAFEEAERPALARDDAAVLDGWLQRRELILQPGQRQEVQLEMDDEASYLALAVFFLDVEAERWRLLEPLPDSFLGLRPGQRLTLALDGGALWVGRDAERKRAAWPRDEATGQRRSAGR